MFSDKTGPDLESFWSEETPWLEQGKPLPGAARCDTDLSGKPSTRASQASIICPHLPVGSGLANGIATCPISMVHVLNLMILFGVPR